MKLEEELGKSEEWKKHRFKLEEESDEIQGLAAQELAKIKHLVCIDLAMKGVVVGGGGELLFTILDPSFAIHLKIMTLFH